MSDLNEIDVQVKLAENLMRDIFEKLLEPSLDEDYNMQLISELHSLVMSRRNRLLIMKKQLFEVSGDIAGMGNRVHAYKRKADSEISPDTYRFKDSWKDDESKRIARMKSTK